MKFIEALSRLLSRTKPAPPSAPVVPSLPPPPPLPAPTFVDGNPVRIMKDGRYTWAETRRVSNILLIRGQHSDHKPISLHESPQGNLWRAPGDFTAESSPQAENNRGALTLHTFQVAGLSDGDVLQLHFIRL